jgi:hypothetical protein
MRASLDWSYDLLTPDEKSLFGQLGVFSGGWTAEAAAAICVDRVGDRVVEVLGQLIDKSMVVVDDRRAGQRRYQMLETVRQYAVERLAETDISSIVHVRHLSWYVNLAERVSRELGGPDEGSDIDILESERDNFDAALAWSVQHAPRLGLRLATSLGSLWFRRGYRREGCRWIETLLESTPVVKSPADDREYAGLRAKSLFMLRHSLPADRLIDGYRFLRWMTWIDPDDVRPPTFDLAAELHAHLPGFVSPDRIADQLQEALELWRELGDARSRCLGLGQLSILQLLRGETALVRQLLQQTLEAARQIDDPALIGWQIDDPALIGWALIQLCSINPIARVTPEPGRLAAESRALFEEVGDYYGATRAIVYLGETAFGEGRLTEAEAYLVESHERVLRQRDVLSTRALEMGLGLLARAQGDGDRAERYLTEVLPHYEKLDYHDHVGIICANLGSLVGRRGDVDRGRQLLAESLSRFREAHNRPGIALGLCLMGLHHERRRDRARAVRLLFAAVEQFPAVTAFLDRDERLEHDRIVADVTGSTTGEIPPHLIEGHRLTTDLAVAYAIA